MISTSGSLICTLPLTSEIPKWIPTIINAIQDGSYIPGFKYTDCAARLDALRRFLDKEYEPVLCLKSVISRNEELYSKWVNLIGGEEKRKDALLSMPKTPCSWQLAETTLLTHRLLTLSPISPLPPDQSVVECVNWSLWLLSWIVHPSQTMKFNGAVTVIDAQSPDSPLAVALVLKENLPAVTFLGKYIPPCKKRKRTDTTNLVVIAKPVSEPPVVVNAVDLTDQKE